MRVCCDDEVDALYLGSGEETPDGVVEIAEGANVDTTSDGRIAGIEILNATKKIDLKTILTYGLELQKCLVTQETTSQRERCSEPAILNSGAKQTDQYVD